MIEDLYSKGIKQVSVTYTPALLNYVLNEKNYSPPKKSIGYDTPPLNCLEISALNHDMFSEFLKGLPLSLTRGTEHLFKSCSVIMCEKGFTLPPHRDFYDVPDMRDKSLLAILVTYLCPYDFEGRHFVYGRVKEIDPLRKEPYDWGHPNLEVTGSIVPKTGTGVLIDAINPVWWHAVSPLTNGGPVIAFSVSLY